MKRTCKKCGEIKPLIEFTKDINCKNGHQHTCKKCTTKLALERVHKKRDKENLIMENWNRKIQPLLTCLRENNNIKTQLTLNKRYEKTKL